MSRAGTLRGSMRWTRRVERALAFAVLVAMSCLFMIPILITLSDSLKTFVEIYRQPRVWIPDPPRFENYVRIFQILPFHRFFLNTLAITVLALLGQVGGACVVGHSFARLRWPFRDTMFLLLLCTIMLPPQVTLIKKLIIFNKIGWYNTWLPLIVPAYFGGGVFNIFLMRQFFRRSPRLEDPRKSTDVRPAASFLQSHAAMAKPAIATVCVLGFIQYWNDFQSPLIYLTDYPEIPIRWACTCS